MSDILCPCQSELPFLQCCKPYLSGLMIPQTPLALMRSRYCAYSQNNANYIVNTWYFPDSQNQKLLFESIKESFQNTQWIDLKIINTEDDLTNPSQGFVEFMAYFIDRTNGQKHVIHERSRFILNDQRWYYIDGVKPHVERNSPCPCGSGKKYKKCCY